MEKQVTMSAEPKKILSYTDPKTILRPKLLDVPRVVLKIKQPSALKTKKQRGSSRPEKSTANAYFSEKDLLFGEDDPVELEGDLYRFKPGIQHNFISRWV
jgi:hypothetical protein